MCLRLKSHLSDASLFLFHPKNSQNPRSIYATKLGLLMNRLEENSLDPDILPEKPPYRFNVSWPALAHDFCTAAVAISCIYPFDVFHYNSGDHQLDCAKTRPSTGRARHTATEDMKWCRHREQQSATHQPIRKQIGEVLDTFRSKACQSHGIRAECVCSMMGCMHSSQGSKSKPSKSRSRSKGESSKERRANSKDLLVLCVHPAEQH